MALESIIKNVQNNDVEIIVVDGCSTDGTSEIIEDYSSKYKFIKIIRNKKRIVSSGFNMALNKAKGNIIIRIDGHCEIQPNFIENCIMLFKRTDADVVGGRIKTLSHGFIGNAISVAQSSWFGVGGARFRMSSKREGCYVNSLAFGAHKRNVFLEIGGYDEELICNQDEEFNYRLIQGGKKIWMDPSIVTKYYSRSNYLKLFKQYFKYGYFKVRVIQKRNQVFSLRHLIPSIFISSLLITLVYGYYLNDFKLLFLIFLIYSFFNLSSCIISSKIKLWPMVYIAYFILHFSYGSGFIVGFFKFILKWRDKELKDTHFNKSLFIKNG